MKGKSRKFPFFSASALWDYLNQAIFSPHTRFTLNPLDFTRPRRVQRLKQCWEMDYELERSRNKLEICWHRTPFSEHRDYAAPPE